VTTCNYEYAISLPHGVERTCVRLKATARRVAHARSAPEFVEDLVQETMLRYFEGATYPRLDNRTVAQFMHECIDTWRHDRVRKGNVRAVAEMMAVRLPNPLAMWELKKIYSTATEREKQAILNLMLHGHNSRHKRTSEERKEAQRSADAMCCLRARLGIRPFSHRKSFLVVNGKPKARLKSSGSLH
jgi:DNA-directed RNA polymerase specialized sigma24 family protein